MPGNIQQLKPLLAPKTTMGRRAVRLITYHTYEDASDAIEGAVIMKGADLQHMT